MNVLTINNIYPGDAHDGICIMAIRIYSLGKLNDHKHTVGIPQLYNLSTNHKSNGSHNHFSQWIV